MREITLLEQLAHSLQDALKHWEKGTERNRLVARLARIDQLIANFKSRVDHPGNLVCTYLDD